MKRFAVLFAIYALAVGGAMAQRVSMDVASKCAAQFASSYLHMEVQRVDASPAASLFQNIYLFNINQSEGFVVMSADESVQPILAYSPTAALGKELPAAAAAMLANYDSQIATLASGQNSAYTDTPIANDNRQQWGRLASAENVEPAAPAGVTIVGPLIETSWGEGIYYNATCPPISNSVSDPHAMAGSSAVAIAQLLRYWRFPSVGSGRRVYTTTSFGQQTVYFNETTDDSYNYSVMPRQLTQFSVDDQINAVSALVYKCGVAVATQYQYEANGGSASCFANIMADSVLSRYFCYQKCYTQFVRSDYSDSAWFLLLKADLDQGRPIIYAGGTGSDQRTFLCDGYDSEHRLHFNWGNSGLADGFFAVDNLAPTFSSTPFTSSQQAIVSILPNSTSLIVSPLEMTIDGPGGSQMISVLSSSSSAQWTASSWPDWLSLSPQSGRGGGIQTSLIVTASPNLTGAERTATFRITQANSVKTITIHQPDGTPSGTGWYGNASDYSFNGNSATDAGDMIVLRPDAFANLYAGQRVTKVCFMDNAGSGNYTIRIYEESAFDAGLKRDGHTTDIAGCLGTENTLYTTVYQHQSTVDGIQTVTLPNGGYRVTRNKFWVTVTSHSGCTFCSRRVPHSAMTDESVEIPLVDSLRAGYLYTKNNELRIAYDYDIIENRQYDVEFLLAIYVEGDVDTCSNVYIREEATACDAYTWHHKTYTTSSGSHDPYIDTVSITEDCDSIFMLYLDVESSSPLTQASASACSTMVWHDTTLATSGSYTHTFSNMAGCDSTVQLSFTVLNSAGSETLHECDSLKWNGSTYRRSGTFQTTLTNASGCDSLVTLYLTLGYGDHFNDYVAKCDSAVWYGRTYTESIVTTHSYVNAQGCTSVDTLHLTINKHNEIDTFATRNERYSWRGTTYRTTGRYAQRFTNQYGCDSIIYLNLTILNPCQTTYHDEYATACDSIVWRGQTLRSTGSDYQVVLTNSRGCDSIISLDLTINNSTSGHGAWAACDSFVVGSHIYRTSGIYVDTLTAANLCDSVNTLTLTILPTTYGDSTATAIDHFVWYGTTYRQQGTNIYYHTLRNTNNCDSIVALSLTIVSGTTFGDTNAVVCGYYNWRGQTLTESGEYEKLVGLNSLGYDSVVFLHLTVWPIYTVDLYQTACQSYTWDNDKIKRETSGTYSFKMYSRAHCDSTIYLHLTIVQPVFDTIYGTLQGGTYTWDGRQYTQPNTYRWIYHVEDRCDSTVYLILKGEGEGIGDIATAGIRLYAAQHGVVVEGAEGMPITVVDAVGRVVAHIAKATQPTLFIPVGHTGLYLLRIGSYNAKQVVVAR